MVWSTSSVGNAGWYSNDGFGIVIYGEALYGNGAYDMIWAVVSTGNAGWV